MQKRKNTLLLPVQPSSSVLPKKQPLTTTHKKKNNIEKIKDLHVSQKQLVYKSQMQQNH